MSALKRFRNAGKKYKLEDRYQHHLGILKSIMRSVGMDEMEPLCNILPRIRHMAQDNAVLKQATEEAISKGVSFVRVSAFTEPGKELVGISVERINPERIVIQVLPDETGKSDS